MCQIRSSSMPGRRVHWTPIFVVATALALAVACGEGEKDTQPLAQDTDTPGAVDADGDGFASDEDCDDSDAEVHPGAVELCNGQDDDCDGAVDEEDAADAPTWYTDGDGDGYGNAHFGTVACQQPDGTAAADGDCDDSDAAVHPGAEEICGDDVDEDCDGMTQSCIISGTIGMEHADARFIGEAIGDQAGYSVAIVGDVDGDGFGDMLIGAYDASCGEDGEGAAYLVLGPASGDVELVDADASFCLPNENSALGYSVSGAGDVNADGYHDLLMGAPWSGPSNPYTGAAFLVLGPVSGELDLAAADARLLGEVTNDNAGISVSGAGDVDGDGHDDLLVGAPNHDDGRYGYGTAYLVLGPVSGDLDLGDADAKLNHAEGVSKVGSDVSGAGDVDGDGIDDLLVAADDAPDDYGFIRWAYLVLAPVTGEVDLRDADAAFAQGGWPPEEIVVSDAGDVDGDGRDDFLIASPHHPYNGIENGVVFLVTSSVSGEVSLYNADATLWGQSGSEWAGTSLSAAGDLDQDGFDDVLVGAPGYENHGASGAVYLLRGPVYGAMSLVGADATLVGEAVGDRAGYVSGGGDIDADGIADILIGAPRSDLGGYASGAAYLMSSRAP